MLLIGNDQRQAQKKGLGEFGQTFSSAFMSDPALSCDYVLQLDQEFRLV